jgi:hypothetical protein
MKKDLFIMKKTLLALAVASLSTSAFADISDSFSTSATVGVGGYYDTVSEELYDDWATALTVSTSFKNESGVVGYLEVDLELNWTTDEDKTGIQNGPGTDVDKAWIGYDTGYGIASFGFENDTALDKVDGAGDYTYEFGSSAGDASDAFNVVKFQGATSGFAYGISYFETDDDADVEDSGINGYIGLEQDTVNVYLGYETRDDADYDVISLSGNATFGDVGVGANAWINDADAGGETTGLYLSAGYNVTEKVNVSAGYLTTSLEVDGASDVDGEAVNVALVYTANASLNMGVDVLYDTEEEETAVFAAAFYSF